MKMIFKNYEDYDTSKFKSMTDNIWYYPIIHGNTYIEDMLFIDNENILMAIDDLIGNIKNRYENYII